MTTRYSCGMQTNNKVWIIGCGDIGKRVARLYGESPVNGVVSSLDFAKGNLSNLHLQAINLDQPFTLNLADFIGADIYYFAPPPPTGQKDTRLEAFLKQLGAVVPRRIVLISTTGVYGDSGGDWIDESTPVKPQADRARRRVTAEELLKQWAAKTLCDYMILRVPGIYAADRLPIARIEKGLPIVNENEAGFTNRIHADDLAYICKTAMESQIKNETINVTDGHPSTMTEYFNTVADYAGLPRPPQISMAEAQRTLTDGMVSYLKESRKISNQKMLDLLKVELKYPNLKSSLKINKTG